MVNPGRIVRVLMMPCLWVAGCELVGDIKERPLAPASLDGGGGAGGGREEGGASSQIPISCEFQAYPDSATKYCSDGQAQSSDCALSQDGSSVTPQEWTSFDDRILDMQTGLLWSPLSSEPLSRSAAESFCVERSLRLPSLKELVSILDYGGLDTLSNEIWADVPADVRLWAEETVNGAEYRVAAHSGMVFFAEEETHAFCVGCTPQAWSYSEGAGVEEGILLSEPAKLEWEMEPQPEALRWLDALQECDELEFGGFSDWRLPTIKELVTLIDASNMPMVPTELMAVDFPGDTIFWSSTPFPHDAGSAWFVDFSNGVVATGLVKATHAVRCVRTSNAFPDL